MKWNKSPSGVWTTDEEVITVEPHVLKELREAAIHSPRKRARICAHQSPDNPVHEMLIALDKSTYVQPHRHHKKSESFHIIEGKVRIVLFREDGSLREQVVLGDHTTGRAFYYRIATPIFHTLIIESDMLVIHETTTGPFVPEETEFAPWAPSERDSPDKIADYMAELKSITAKESAA